MNKEDIIPVVIVLSVLTLLLAIIASVTISDMLIADMVNKGIDPIKARCAISGFSEGAKVAVCLEAIK